MKLSDGNTDIQLPDDLQWIDELSWSGVGQTTERSVSGALIVDAGTMANGRPISLQSGAEVWLTRVTVEAIRSFAAVAGQEMTLTSAEGDEYSVIFDHEKGAIDAQPIHFSAPAADTDPHQVTLRFLTI